MIKVVVVIFPYTLAIAFTITNTALQMLQYKCCLQQIQLCYYIQGAVD